MRFFQLLGLTLLGMCAGCAWGDRNLEPGPAPIVGIASGAALNTGMLLLKRPWYERLIATGGLAYAGRFTALFGHRMEGWHLEVTFGAGVSEWVSWFACSGPCK